MDPSFIHLRLHSEFSLADGLLTIPDIMQKAITYGMPAIAITDLNNLYATVKFYKEALNAGIKPIIGVDLHLFRADQPHHPFLISLLCQNQTGYLNLLKLISLAYLKGQNNRTPMIESSWLSDHAEGLIALSGGIHGELGHAALEQDKKRIEEVITFYNTLFPKRFYLEISRIGRPDENRYISKIATIARQYNLPLVATNDIRFAEKSDFEAHEARVCIQEGAILNDPNRSKHYTDQQYFRSPQEMQQLFADLPNALKNTIEIAKRCNVSISLGTSKLPYFPVPEHYTTETYLGHLAKEGLEARLKMTMQEDDPKRSEKRAAYHARLTRELDVINAMGFAGYFQIVADFTKWAKENGIPVGPGRGSGPGSLVAYSLNITDLDPLALDLLFERFLNPERVSMPDFDIDFCMEGRDRVIQYVMDKHGHDSVSQIITYGTMAAKAVVRDVGRVLGLGYGFVDKIAKLIPFELGITLEKALDQEPLLRDRYSQEEEVKTLIDLALKLEGITRNVGKHAGGIVIAPGKLTDFVPLYCESHESTHLVTQFDKDDVEAVGLVKFDFLGLKTLTIIDRALHVINRKRTEAKEPAIDISLIALNDVKTFQLLKACKSTAVFQLESHGMRDLIKRLQPDCFEDLIALVALFRPGPLQSGMVEDFINRKHGRAQISYPHAKLEPVLRPTYGVIVYQEQVMQIAQVLAGYTLGAADILRRAMGKKKPEEMAKQREVFCKGALQTNQIPAELANQLFDLMEKFAAYGFNKSHSAAYALIAYQTAWLKAHYPAAFMAAVLSSDMDKTEKVIIALDECEDLKLHVSPPNINHSDYMFTVLSDTQLMYGLGAIKGAGAAAIENILTTRLNDGPFLDLYDFCKRIDLRKVNKRVIEALIKSGCFDALGVHRATLINSLSNAMQHAEQATHNQVHGQQDLLSMDTGISQSPPYLETTPWADDLQLQGEKETLGFYLTGHPLRRFLNELTQFTTGRLAEIHPSDHKTARLAGIITTIRTRITKRGDRIGIFTLDDGTSQMEVVCFSDCYQQYRSLLVDDQMIIVEGEIGIDDFSNSPRMLARDLYTLEQARLKLAKQIRLPFNDTQPINASKLKSVLTPFRGGNCHISLRYIKDHIQADISLGKNWLIQPSDVLLKQLEQTCGLKEVEFIY